MIHFSFLDAWAMFKEIKVGDQGHSAISEYTSGVEQTAALWDRPKRAYDVSLKFDREVDQAEIDALLWIKRNLAGQSGRVWVPEKIAELIAEETFAYGDGSTKGFLVPVFDGIAADDLKVYNDGVFTDLDGAESTANEVSEDLAYALDYQDWTLTNAAAYAEANYQWLWTEGCVEIVPSSAAIVTAEAIAAERVAATWPTGAEMYATVALRGDITTDISVGITQYNDVPTQIDQDFGTAVTISEGEWTLVSSGAVACASGFNSAAVTIQTDGATVGSADNFFIGGACLNLYPGAQWFDPSTCPWVVQFGTAPTDGDALAFSGREKRITRSRLAADNLNHAIDPIGHVSIGRLKFLEVIE